MTRNDPLARVGTRRTRQTDRADPRQARNAAGGYVFELDDLARLRRFLVLGTDGGTYYASERELTRESAELVLRLARERPRELVDVIVETSLAGRAPRQQPCLFALAVAAATEDVEARRRALARLPAVARTGTHLFQFATYVELFRGWGPTLRRAVGDWYRRPLLVSDAVDGPSSYDRALRDLTYQVIKYRQRDGWTHRDLLRLAHPDPGDATDLKNLYEWVCRGFEVTADHRPALDLVWAYQQVQRTTDPRRVVELVREHRLPWEALPDWALTRAETWETLLDAGLPQTALLRQLPRLTRLGLIHPLGAWTQRVCEQLTDAERLRRARVHPLAVLTAHHTYEQGHGDQGRSTWTPSRPVLDALDAAFYASFGAVEPTGRRLMLALDVSGSMTVGRVARSPLTPREASAALALVTASVESSYEVVGFTSGGSQYFRPGYGWRGDSALTPLAISPRQRLADAVRAVSNLPFGGTDCALPMLHATRRGLEVDAFVIYTDSETWAGAVHPHQALREYRERSGIAARLVVVGLTSTGFTIADPADAGMLDVVGFDLATPQLVSDFVRGAT